MPFFSHRWLAGYHPPFLKVRMTAPCYSAWTIGKLNSVREIADVHRHMSTSQWRVFAILNVSRRWTWRAVTRGPMSTNVTERRRPSLRRMGLWNPNAFWTSYRTCNVLVGDGHRLRKAPASDLPCILNEMVVFSGTFKEHWHRFYLRRWRD